MARPERHLLVCLNRRPSDNPKGSCADKGAEELLQQFKAAVSQGGLAGRVIVSGTRCLKHCSRGVTVAVYPDNAWYAGVTPGDVQEICETQLRDGRVVGRLEMPDIPWE